MPKHVYRSPYTNSFQSAVNRGTPASTAVSNIAKRTNKTPKTIISSLSKAGVIENQKFNSQQIFWPQQAKKGSATNRRSAQASIYQAVVDWAITSGQITPEQLSHRASSQQQFLNAVRQLFGTQFSSSTSSRQNTSQSPRRTSSQSLHRTSTQSRRRTSTQSRRTSTMASPRTSSRTSQTRKTSAPRTLKFSSTSTRRVRQAA